MNVRECARANRNRRHWIDRSLNSVKSVILVINTYNNIIIIIDGHEYVSKLFLKSSLKSTIIETKYPQISFKIPFQFYNIIVIIIILKSIFRFFTTCAYCKIHKNLIGKRNNKRMAYYTYNNAVLNFDDRVKVVQVLVKGMRGAASSRGNRFRNLYKWSSFPFYSAFACNYKRSIL